MRESYLIKILNKKYKTSPTNTISFSRTDLKKYRLKEFEVTRILTTLESDGYLSIHKINPRVNDLSIKWDLTLSGKCVNYFHNKRKIKSEKISKWIQFIIPTGISLLALFRPEITALMKQIMLILK